jgi:hypothetical protein
MPYTALSQYKILLNKAKLFGYNQSYLINIPLKQNTQNLFLVDNKGLLTSDTLHQQFITLLGQSIDTIIVTQRIKQKTYIFRKDPTYDNVDTSYAMITGHNNFVKTGAINGIKERINSYTELRQIDTSMFKDSVLIYYEESYGSVCCPRDPKWNLKNSLKKFIMNFEKSHNVKIGKVYVESYGDEGEHVCYFTLSSLTGKQKVEFISKRLCDLIPNGETKKTTVLLMPYWILNPDRGKVN